MVQVARVAAGYSPHRQGFTCKRLCDIGYPLPVSMDGVTRLARASSNCGRMRQNTWLSSVYPIAPPGLFVDAEDLVLQIMIQLTGGKSGAKVFDHVGVQIISPMMGIMRFMVFKVVVDLILQTRDRPIEFLLMMNMNTFEFSMAHKSLPPFFLPDRNALPVDPVSI